MGLKRDQLQHNNTVSHLPPLLQHTPAMQEEEEKEERTQLTPTNLSASKRSLLLQEECTKMVLIPLWLLLLPLPLPIWKEQRLPFTTHTALLLALLLLLRRKRDPLMTQTALAKSWTG